MQDLTKTTAGATITQTISKVNLMPAEYEIGQKVIVTPGNEQDLSTRESDLRQYAGLTGEITNYYWTRPPAGEAFYLYTVRIGAGNKDIVLYEDEMQPLLSKKSKRRSLNDK